MLILAADHLKVHKKITDIRIALVRTLGHGLSGDTLQFLRYLVVQPGDRRRFAVKNRIANVTLRRSGKSRLAGAHIDDILERPFAGGVSAFGAISDNDFYPPLKGVRVGDGSVTVHVLVIDSLGVSPE